MKSAALNVNQPNSVDWTFRILLPEFREEINKFIMSNILCSGKNIYAFLPGYRKFLHFAIQIDSFIYGADVVHFLNHIFLLAHLSLLYFFMEHPAESYW